MRQGPQPRRAAGGVQKREGLQEVVFAPVPNPVIS
jgi:hypothetical protein